MTAREAFEIWWEQPGGGAEQYNKVTKAVALASFVAGARWFSEEMPPRARIEAGIEAASWKHTEV